MGSTINVLSNAYNPPATPLDQNLAWQEVNKQLNATVQFNVVAPVDYPAKMGTTMAGNDLPDVMLFPGGLNVTLAPVGHGAICRNSCRQVRRPDALPGRRCDQGLPVPGRYSDVCLAELRVRLQWQAVHAAAAALCRRVGRFFKNANIYDAEIGKDYVPKNRRRS